MLPNGLSYIDVDGILNNSNEVVVDVVVFVVVVVCGGGGNSFKFAFDDRVK